MKLSYFKDILRIGFAAVASSGAIIQTSNWVERGLILALAGMILIFSFMLDSTDPRTRERARRILELEKEGWKIAESFTGLKSNSTTTFMKDVKAAKKIAKKAKVEFSLDDILAPDAKPAVNGVPPQE